MTNSMQNLEKLRRERGLNQQQLAEMAGIGQPYLSKIERGYDGLTVATCKDIAAALGVDLADLFATDRSTAEAALLQAFRALPPDRQQGWLDMAKLVKGHPEESAAEMPATGPR